MSLDEFYRSVYYDAIISVPYVLTEWIEYTDEEKTGDPEKSLVGGFLKQYGAKEAWVRWWERLTGENKEIIKSMPNFDANIFKDITGIEV